MESKESRLDFNHFVDKAFWAMLLGIVTYGVKFLGDLTRSVQDLNSKIEVVVYETRLHDYGINDHERRITQIEIWRANKESPNVVGPSPPPFSRPSMPRRRLREP